MMTNDFNEVMYCQGKGCAIWGSYEWYDAKQITLDSDMPDGYEDVGKEYTSIPGIGYKYIRSIEPGLKGEGCCGLVTKGCES